MLIRPASSADVPDLYELALIFDAPGLTAPFPAYRERMAEIVGDSRMLVLVCAGSGGLAAYALAQDYGRNPRRQFTTGRLHDLFVRPEVRRQGIGRRLMAAVTSWAQDRGMILDWQSRWDAVPFYESLGLAKDTVGDQADFPGFCYDFRPSP